MALDKVKKVVIWLVVAFVAYAIFTSPAKSADIVHSAWSTIHGGGHQIGMFFHHLMKS